jgi:DNA mismatch repair protein MutS
MRQVALLTLLAHAGSFVPAESAQVPLLRQIFTRIGAHDNVALGLSTFMVEMTETADIIKSATEDSLVILDEIGRGTSTYDGMSLAQAVLEHFIENVKSYTMFATHYHELTNLAESKKQIVNAHMAIKEQRGNLFFLRKLQKGPANRSYGIDVAKQAGLPESLTSHAQNILNGLIQHARDLQSRQLNLLDRVTSEAMEAGAASKADEKLKLLGEQLKNLKINDLTPLEALNRLSEFHNELQN